tara:strand:- start:125 stop:421 length:297 start_codon:yes stop_codon:yes gene_type:complete
MNNLFQSIKQAVKDVIPTVDLSRIKSEYKRLKKKKESGTLTEADMYQAGMLKAQAEKIMKDHGMTKENLRSRTRKAIGLAVALEVTLWSVLACIIFDF